MTAANEIDFVNNQVDKVAYEGSLLTEFKPTVGFLEKLLEYDLSVVKLAMGSTGALLRAFAGVVDLKHPDLPLFLDGQLTSDCEFTQLATELLSVATYVQSQNFSIVASHLCKILTKLPVYSTIPTYISDLSKKTANHARFIADKDLRNTIRSGKVSQNISLYNFYTKRRDSWDQIPGSFAHFVRNVKPYEEEIGKLTRRIDHFSSIGLTESVNKMAEELNSLKLYGEGSYYGFNRCPLNVAIVILAKVHGFQMNSIGKDPRARVTPEVLKQVKSVAGLMIGVLYQPRLYTVNKLAVPERMQKLMDHLDQFPEAGGKPIFDHFCVITPSLEKDMDILSEISPKMQEMDRKLIENNIMTPVLFGEREGNNISWIIGDEKVEITPQAQEKLLELFEDVGLEFPVLYFRSAKSEHGTELSLDIIPESDIVREDMVFTFGKIKTAMRFDDQPNFVSTVVDYIHNPKGFLLK